MGADVLVVGAGPAGIATAIAASLKGLRVTVADYRLPPIDKPCGEGLLPEAVAALRRFGIGLDSKRAFPLSGFRFTDENSTASAKIEAGPAFGMRRTALHELLVQRAAEVGVSFLWGAHVSDFQRNGARVGGAFVSCKWLVGADGQNSVVRKWARLGSRGTRHSRFGFRRHFFIPPWTDLVEVHWGERRQMVITPTAPEEICISVFSSDPKVRIDAALDQFPEAAARLRGARGATPEQGAISALDRAQAVVCGHVALVGDASCTVDGIAGHGMSLAFQQASLLADALAREDLASYESAHRRASIMPARMTRLLLLMDRSTWLRKKVLRLFAGKPELFSKMIGMHTRGWTTDALQARDLFDLSWNVLRA
ncbi:MAG: NAD(P)/FAD-dependent oxidoreductase [Candidatus Acidiferrales bacterium]